MDILTAIARIAKTADKEAKFWIDEAERETKAIRAAIEGKGHQAALENMDYPALALSIAKIHASYREYLRTVIKEFEEADLATSEANRLSPN